MGFNIRRSTSVPSADEIAASGATWLVEDETAGGGGTPGDRFACCLGEFTDHTYAVAVDASGVVTSDPRPVQIFNPTDADLKLGGLDSTTGHWGGALGNGWEQIQHDWNGNLVCVPINRCSSRGIRMWRDLPTNQSATVAEPIVTVSEGVVPAGYEFKSVANRVLTGARVVFGATPHYLAKTDGVIAVAGLPAATQTFDSTLGLFTSVVRPDGTQGVKEGDIFVIDVLPATSAGTYRVVSVTDVDTVVLQRMDGTNFTVSNWANGTALPYRVYTPEVADTGGEHQLSESGGYLIPARPLDATIAADTNVSPTVAPTAGTASTWDPLSGLKMRTINTTGLVYLPNVQAVNAANHADIDTEYGLAFAALKQAHDAAEDALFIWSARKYNLIHARGLAFEIAAGARGRKRVYIESPILTTVTAAAIFGDADPGVGARRDSCKVYAAPGVQHSITGLRNKVIATADGHTTTTGRIDTTMDHYIANILVHLSPHRSIAQQSEPVASIMLPILGVQRGVAASVLDDDFYERAYLKGVVAPRKKRTKAGMRYLPENQRTTYAAKSDLQNLNTVVFLGFIGDTAAGILEPYKEEPFSDSLADDCLGELESWLKGLMSADDPERSILKNYYLALEPLDDLIEAGVIPIRLEVQMHPIARAFLVRLRVGNGKVTVSFE